MNTKAYIIIFMKNIFFILFLSLGLITLSNAGGDDRDQQLPLNSLNTEQEIDEDGVPRFLQEDEEISQDETIQQGQKEIEDLIQTKLVTQEIDSSTTDGIDSTDSQASTSKIKIFVDQYIKSDQGILILLFLFVVSLILTFNFFVREK
tara:strand:- start:156 stop:599 length:444 start_codon:yes stop_codon:yes gene_type:complete